MEEEKNTPAVEWDESPTPKRRKRTRKKKAEPAKPAEPQETKPTKPETASEPVEGGVPDAPQEHEPAEPEAPDEPKTAEPVEVTEPAEPADTDTETPVSPDTVGGGVPDAPQSGESPEPETAEAAETSDAPQDDAPTESETAEPELPDEDTPEQRERTETISRTAQMSIAQIMAGLEDNPQPAPAADTTDDSDDEDEPEDTIPQKLGRGAFGMFKWLLLVILFILVIAGGGVAWLYRSATPDMLPEIKATFDGVELTPTAYRWHVPVVGRIFKRTYAETLSSAPVELEDAVSGASPDVIVTPNSGYTAELTITDADQEEVYSGSVTAFRSYLFAENGTYDAKLVVTAAEGASDTTGITGSETWQFRFTISIRPTIQLATNSVQQGSVAAIRVGPTLGGTVPTIKTTLENVGFVKAANGWICYLPIPWNEQTGDKAITVTADGYSEELSLTVRAADFTYKDYSSTSQMTSPYIGADDAPAAVKKLLGASDLDIQWSVGGFVQPFLDSFSTPLTFGMTEYAGRSYSERGTNYGYGGRTSTNVVIQPKSRKDSMIVPASGKILLAEDLGDGYGNTVVIDHGAGLKSIFYNLGELYVEKGDSVKQGQLLAMCSKTVVAEMRLGTVPIDPLQVWRGQCDALKIY